MSTPERLELVNLLWRLALELERQQPGTSQHEACFRHYAKWFAADPDDGIDRDKAAEVAMRGTEQVVTRVSRPKPRPSYLYKGRRTPWSA